MPLVVSPLDTQAFRSNDQPKMATGKEFTDSFAHHDLRLRPLVRCEIAHEHLIYTAIFLKELVVVWLENGRKAL